MRGCLILIAVLAAGCSPGKYARQRAYDAGDMFRFHIGSGHGILANVQVSRYIALGAGEYSVDRMGCVRGKYGAWHETRGDMNLVIPIHGYTDITKVESGTIKPTVKREQSVKPWVRLTVNDETRGPAEVSLNVHVIIIGLDIGFGFGEFADFLLGFAGVDIMNDDYRRTLDAAGADAVYLRAQAAWKLGNRPGPESVKALSKLMHDEVAEVRAQAVKSLGKIGDDSTLPTIVEAVDDPDAGVRMEAKTAIENIVDRAFLDMNDLRDWLREQKWYVAPKLVIPNK